jgi:anaerobic dimethyl sulfoxide reductase subunit A
MSEKKNETLTEKKVSRRSMLKWTGALAAAAAVGAVAEYGASELMKPVPPPPPPPISFKPPLTPQIQQRVDAIKQQLIAKHSGEAKFYSSCSVNGCWFPCIIPTRVKNGVITAFDTDDTINPGALREDAVVGMDAVRQQMIQARGCSRGFSRRRNIYAPSRLAYPMKRGGERGERKWVRISWQEALDTITQKIQGLVEKYGPNIDTQAGFASYGPGNGYGYATYQSSSFSGTEFSERWMLGGNPPPTGIAWGALSAEGPDLLNPKLIVGIGWNPLITKIEATYWLTLAKDKGIPMIWIEPTYSVSANVLADQWIPIRPGTDAAMLLAIANVLFKEDLYDKDYVSKFVEPTGFQKWKDYVLGNIAGEDGAIDRTPEWQESITAVPAETVRELARLYARSKPAYFRVHWAAARQLETDATAAAGIALQAMTGNIGVPGGWHNGSGIGVPTRVPVPFIGWKSAKATYAPSTIWYGRGWLDALVLRDKLQNNEISEAEYRQRIGVDAVMPLPNPRMMWISNNRLSGTHDVNKQIQALKKLDFVVASSWHISNPGIFMADIVLPLTEHYWEAQGTATGSPSYKYPSSNTGTGVSNYVFLTDKIIQAPGEAKTNFWIQVQVAKRLGVADKWVPDLANVPDDQWDAKITELLKAAYETWAKRPDIAAQNPPTWDDFSKKPVYRVPVPLDQEPFVEYRGKITKGEKFRTASGKIEVFCQSIANGDVATKGMPFTKDFRGVGDMCHGGSYPPQIPPMAEWHLQRNSIIGPLSKQYPLMVISSHSFYRQHSSQDNNPLLFPDECRHACWLSVADAKARGIKDGDLVRVYNDGLGGLGMGAEMVLPAYVTSRLMPGTCRVGFGAWWVPSDTKTALMPLGVDRRGMQNFLTPSVHYPWIVGPVMCTNLVQVDKFGGPGPEVTPPG